MSRHIIKGYDPASENWLEQLAEMPKQTLEIDYDFVQRKVNAANKRYLERWHAGSFEPLTVDDAVAVLIAQHYRCAVTANLRGCNCACELVRC